MEMFGFRPIALVGTATGRIGDPSGKNSERPQLEDEQLQSNVDGIRRSVECVLCRYDDSAFYKDRLRRAGELPGGSGEPASTASAGLAHASDESPSTMVVENGDFYANMSALDFLGSVGRNFRMSTMLSRDSVRSRLQSEAGLSYTEFSYQMLQAWDFWSLYRQHGCALQIGGSDQWGNIVSGVDLVRRLSGDEVFGLTVPLLTTAAGTKIGKSEGNAAVWLNPEDTPHYSFYQYFMRLADDDAAALLPKLTLLPLADVRVAVAEHTEKPHLRGAQRLLAAEVTRLVRGREALAVAEAATGLLHGGDPAAGGGGGATESATAAADELLRCVESGAIPGTLLTRAALQASSPLDLAVASGIAGSKGEARRLAKAGGLSVNGVRVEAGQAAQTAKGQQLLGGKVLVVGAGKARRHVVGLQE